MTVEVSVPRSTSYTIAEAAALAGLHKNTIRQKVKMGQLEAETRHGKFGEEYRISHDALIRAGLIDGVLEHAELAAEEGAALAVADEASPSPPPAGAAGLPALVTGLGELFQRHENAMFRLGFMQAELERVKSLAENAESLQREREERQVEAERLRSQLEAAREEARAAAALRAELDQARERLRDAEGLRRVLAEMEQEAERLRTAVDAATQPRPWWKRLFP
jgi:excisionase family DNA binding protein